MCPASLAACGSLLQVFPTYANLRERVGAPTLPSTLSFASAQPLLHTNIKKLSLVTDIVIDNGTLLSWIDKPESHEFVETLVGANKPELKVHFPADGKGHDGKGSGTTLAD